MQALGGEAAEDHRVRGADARARLHRDHRLDRHRHVDQDALALLDAVRLERVGELADAVIELLVGDLGHLAVVGLEDDRDLVRLRLEVPVEAVVGGVQLAVVEPLVERRVRLVEHLREGLGPQQVLAREPRPETLEVALGLVAQRLVRGHAGHVGLLHERLRRREDARLLLDGFDLRHCRCSSCRRCVPGGLRRPSCRWRTEFAPGRAFYSTAEARHGPRPPPGKTLTPRPKSHILYKTIDAPQHRC